MQFIVDWLVLALCSTVQNERQDSEKLNHKNGPKLTRGQLKRHKTPVRRKRGNKARKSTFFISVFPYICLYFGSFLTTDRHTVGTDTFRAWVTCARTVSKSALKKMSRQERRSYDR